MGTVFEKELLRRGPGAFMPGSATGGEISLAEAHAYCRRFTRRNSENFSVTTVLLPRPLLRHFCSIYSYCRWADDLGDETGGGAGAGIAPLVAR